LLLFSFRWFHRFAHGSVLLCFPIYLRTYKVTIFMHVSCAVVDFVSAFSTNIHPLLGRLTSNEVGWIRRSNVAMLYLWYSRYSTVPEGNERLDQTFVKLTIGRRSVTTKPYNNRCSHRYPKPIYRQVETAIDRNTNAKGKRLMKWAHGSFPIRTT
jgi:hypothetical protein